jgi:diguanylate cyclase (GGDEF)-like protein
MATVMSELANADPGSTMGSISVLPLLEPRPETRRLISDSTVLRMSTALQSSLFVRDVIRSFSNEAKRIVRRISMRYRNRTDGLSLQEGRLQLHRCTYDLNLLGKSLGEITFTRAQPFTTDEQALLEIMLCALIYPLRNALLYERALRTALKDPLTGINNRANMDQHLDQQVLLATRHGTPLSLLMIDVDLFKGVNDSYGHVVGDAVLIAIAEGIVKCTRNSDVVFRYGGEEFVVVLTNTKLNGAMLLAERIRASIAGMEIKAGEVELRVTISVGVAELQASESSIDIIQRADRMLYRAKSRGRNLVLIDDGE